MSEQILQSLDDLKFHRGLFPDIESFLLYQLLSRILRKLQGVPFDEIQHFFSVFNEMDEGIKHIQSDPIYDQIIEGKNKFLDHFWSNIDQPIILSDEKSDFHDGLIISELLKSLKKSQPDIPDLKDFSVFYESMLPKIEDTDKFIGLIALYFYYFAVQKAIKLETNDEINDTNFRLGKVSIFFYISYGIIEFSSYLKAELIGLKSKDDEIKDKRVNSGKKGAALAHEKKAIVKRELIKAYIPVKEKEGKVNKSQFVYEFIENLSQEKRRAFTPTNIHRNLSNTLTDFDKNRISPQIWPTKDN